MPTPDSAEKPNSSSDSPTAPLAVKHQGTMTEIDRKRLAESRPREALANLGVINTPAGPAVRTLVREEVFDLHHTEYGPLRFFVSQIKAALVANVLDHAVYQTTLTHDWYSAILANNGIEEPRVSSMTPRDLRVLPIAAITRTNDVNFIDGSHRLVYRWRAGVPTFRFIAVHILDLVRDNLVTNSKGRTR